MAKVKKYIIVFLLLIELFSVYLTFNSFSHKEIDKVDEFAEVDKNVFAMYVENDEGKYAEYTDSNSWPSGYKLNESMTMCIDNKGDNITVNSLIFNNNKMTIQSNKTVFCYLYFDKDKSVYAKVRNDYTDNKGALLLSETESDEYPVYYYNGDITNNNILYANFCWKMVRTTETGGVKLIYNGVPTETENGTKTCDNTGDESQIGKSKFNSSGSLAYAGYMYNEVYSLNYKSSINVVIYTFLQMVSSALYYYGDEAIWNEETQQYDLKISSDEGYIDVTETTIWSTGLAGKYTCRTTTDTSCETVSYITGGDSKYMYYYELSEGKNKDDYKIKLATSVTDNKDGTYTLVAPVEVSKAEYAKNYGNYKGYYYCGDLISDTCNDMYYSTSTNVYQLSGYNMANVYKYGNSFEYKDGVYILKDTKEFWDWHNNYNQINNHHYTCFNTTGECENIHYIYYTDSSTVYYITLSEGKSVEDAINEMLYAEDVNKTDSTIKKYIDTWYENSILDKLDNSSNLYSLYLENAIWCNNRKISTLNGWNPNNGDTTKYLYFKYDSLECENKTDQFTLKVEAGGTEEYGNNALDYPIGLISYKEASLASSSGYLKTGNSYWLFSPSILEKGYTYVGFFYKYAEISSNRLHDAVGVRPSVSLSTSVEIIGGNGEVDNPYQVELSS